MFEGIKLTCTPNRVKLNVLKVFELAEREMERERWSFNFNFSLHPLQQRRGGGGPLPCIGKYIPSAVVGTFPSTVFSRDDILSSRYVMGLIFLLCYC